MFINESTLKTFGFEMCHWPLIVQLSNVISPGIEIDGEVHAAVRLAYIQVLVKYTCILLG